MTIEPGLKQFRAAGVSLFLIAAMTGAMIAALYIEAFDGPLLITTIVAYVLFNLGYTYSVVTASLFSRGTRVGLLAVSLNVLAMLLNDFLAIWTVLSLCAVASALLGAFLILHETKRAAAGAE